jgi:hypothetical protein
MLIAVWIGIDTVSNMVISHVSLPFWDAWRTVSEYRDLLSGRFGFDDLLSQHNEHRIAAGRLLFFIDYIAFGGRGVFLSVCILAILSALAGLLIWMTRPADRSEWRGYTVTAAAVAAALLSFVAYENLIWPFQVPFVLLYLSAAGGLYATMRACEAARAGGPWAGWLTLAGVTLTVAVYCMANGLAAVGLSVLLAVMLRAPKAMIATLVVLFASLTAAYFHGYESASKPGGLHYLITHPEALPTYLSMFLGNILRDYPQREGVTAALGIVGLGLCAAIAWRILVRRDLDPVRLVLVALMLFVLAAALASGAGRIADFGLIQALAPRYVTPTALFWSCQALYWTSVARQEPGWRRSVALAGSGLLLMLLAYGQIASRRDASGLLASMTGEADAALVGVRDIEAQNATTPTAEHLPEDLALLRRQGKSIYAEPRAHWMGRPLGSIAKADATCLGFIDNAVRQNARMRGLRLSGWAWDMDHDRRVMQLLIVDGGGRVVGLASGGAFRGDVLTAVRAVDHVGSGWRGYALGNPSEVLTVYGLTGRGSACPLGKVAAPP